MLIPGPDTRVVELRVHGILGTTPEALLDAVSTVDVAGDGAGRIVRPADRLRRPSPGAVLKADGRPLPRTLEGYVWGALTSGGLAKSIWALLFPFSLVNVASWMLPPVPDGNAAARVLGRYCRAVLRLIALLLTLLLIGQFAAVSLDLLAGQCLAPGSRCLAGVVPDWFRQLPMVRTAIGLVPLLVVLFVLDRVSRVNWQVNADHRPEPVRDDADPTTRAAADALAGLPGTGQVADAEAPALRALHLAGSLAVITLLTVGGPAGPTGGPAARACWVASLALLGICLLGALIFADPTRVRTDAPGPLARFGARAAPRRVLVWLGIALAALVVPAVPHPNGASPGTNTALQDITLALAGACVLLGALLVPAALLARSDWSALPTELRPWAGGWIAAPFAVLAAALGGGFGAGVGIVARQALGGAPLALPAGYAYLTLLWGITGALLGVGGLLLAGITVLRHTLAKATGRGVPPETRLLNPGPAELPRAAAAWWTAGLERRHAHHVVMALAAVLAVGALIAGVPWLHGALPPTWAEPLSGVGLTTLVALAGWLLREVYVAARQPATARHLGGLADLASFWPRESHPMVPPCYALKVVPELTDRARQYLADPNTHVVLTGHSQGSVLVVAAMARLLATVPPADRARLGLVTAGSPLQWAYPRAFPAVVPHGGLVALYGALDGRWRALCRGTDPIGGGLTTWRRQVFDEKLIGVGFLGEGATSGALPAATAGPTGALVLGGDHWLPDPQHGPFPGRRWAPGVHRHHDYYSDPEWDRAVACAAGLESPASVADQGMLFRLPGHGRAAGS